MANSRSSTTALQIDLHVLPLLESVESQLWYEVRLQLMQELNLIGLNLIVGLWFPKEYPSYRRNDAIYSTYLQIYPSDGNNKKAHHGRHYIHFYQVCSKSGLYTAFSGYFQASFTNCGLLRLIGN